MDGLEQHRTFRRELIAISAAALATVVAVQVGMGWLPAVLIAAWWLFLFLYVSLGMAARDGDVELARARSRAFVDRDLSRWRGLEADVPAWEWPARGGPGDV